MANSAAVWAADALALHQAWGAVVLVAVLGLLVLLLAACTLWRRCLALAASVPLAALAVAGFATAGFSVGWVGGG